MFFVEIVKNNRTDVGERVICASNLPAMRLIC